MVLYRIAKNAYISDLSGTRPRLYGGRWNPKGMGVIYTSETRALAALELFVHLSRTVIPPSFSLATIEIPDTASIKKITVKDLPRNWRAYPAPTKPAALGASWIRSKESLLLRVPSVSYLLKATSSSIRPIRRRPAFASSRSSPILLIPVCQCEFSEW